MRRFLHAFLSVMLVVGMLFTGSFAHMNRQAAVSTQAGQTAVVTIEEESRTLLTKKKKKNNNTETTAKKSEAAATIKEDGTYDSKDEVALYIHTYNHLPSNYMTKKEAKALGWTGGSLEDYAPGMCIGGDRFGNYEGVLPDKKGVTYTECDIDTLGKSKRGAKRIIFSNKGCIYYTEDHYESFELLYGEE